MSRRIVHEKNTRPPRPFVKQHVSASSKVAQISKGGRPNRPLKAIRPPQVKPDPTLLLSVPVTGTKAAIEYPTPEWFRSTEKADVSVIVPLYKSHDVVADLIATWPLDGRLKWEAIFVDDKCPCNSKEAVLRAWTSRRDQINRPVGKIITNTENKGFGLTCNIGAEFSTGEYVIFLNADTTLTPGWIEPMIDLFQDEQVGIVGNLQIKDGGQWHGTIDSAGSEWNWRHGVFAHIGRHSYHRNDLPQPYKPDAAPKEIMRTAEREMVTGCCLALPSHLFDYIGGFNPNYRIGYWEDSEICMTIRELGYRIMFTPDSVIYHKLSHSNSGAHDFQNYNKQYFYNKWVNSGRIDDFVLDRREDKPQVRTILLKRSGANGDVLMASAVAAALKAKHNGCNILFLTDCPDILQGNPYIDRVVGHSAVSERQFQVYYDLDMAYEYRPKANILDAYAELVGVKRADCKLHIQTEPMNGLPEDFIALHVGRTNWVGRNWRPEYFEQLAHEIRNLGQKIVLVGHGGDFMAPCDLDLRGKTNIAQLAGVIARSKLFVGIDSMPMHIAQAVGKQGVCFFGSIRPETRIINDNMHGVTAPGLACLGCHHRKPTPCVVTNNCEVGGEPCIYGVDVQSMLSKISNLIL